MAMVSGSGDVTADIAHVEDGLEISAARRGGWHCPPPHEYSWLVQAISVRLLRGLKMGQLCHCQQIDVNKPTGVLDLKIETLF